jgi:hypothetical protein
LNCDGDGVLWPEDEEIADEEDGSISTDGAKE